MIWLGGLRLSWAELFGQPVAQSPQPMHLFVSMTDVPFCSVMACTWHLVLQVPQFRQVVGSIMAV